MQLKDMLNSDIDQVIEWIINNQHDYVIVPRELNSEIREEFHQAQEDWDNGDTEECSPDHQWKAMLNCIENT